MGMVQTSKIIKKSPGIRTDVVISQCVQIIAHEEVTPLTGSQTGQHQVRLNTRIERMELN